jgi:hypothetical protein
MEEGALISTKKRGTNIGGEGDYSRQPSTDNTPVAQPEKKKQDSRAEIESA